MINANEYHVLWSRAGANGINLEKSSSMLKIEPVSKSTMLFSSGNVEEHMLQNELARHFGRTVIDGGVRNASIAQM